MVAIAIGLLSAVLFFLPPTRVGTAKPPPPGAAWAPTTILYVELVDQLPASFDGRPPAQTLPERRRGPVFAAVVERAVRARELSPTTTAVRFINDDLARLAGVDERAERTRVPAGAILARVFLTRWDVSGVGGLPAAEVQFRCFVELRRGGRTVRKLGPFTGRAPLRGALFAPEDFRARLDDFAAAARPAVTAWGRALKSSPVGTSILARP